MRSGNARSRVRDRFTAVFAASGVVTLLAGVVVMGAAGTARANHDDSTHDNNTSDFKVEICHATGSASNPYENGRGEIPKWQIADADGHGNEAHGNHELDVIPAFPAGSHGAHSWSDFPGLNTHLLALLETDCDGAEDPDVCPNVDGDQATVPSGMVKNEAGDCVVVAPTPPVDVCPNLGGDQAAVPSGMVKNQAGDCVAPSRPNQPSSIVVSDVAVAQDCDLDTVTTTVTTTTTDFVYDEDKGQWVRGKPVVKVEKTDRRATDEECPPLVLPVEGEDVCPNIEGVQESVPDGMENKRGDCVKPAAGERPGPGAGEKPGGPVIGPDEVAGTEDARPHAVPTAVDAGLGGPVLLDSSPSILLGQGLVGGGLLLLVLAAAMQGGRTGRGAHQF
jgi:hypothetical protein